jgi:hypothetical protein
MVVHLITVLALRIWGDGNDSTTAAWFKFSMTLPRFDKTTSATMPITYRAAQTASRWAHYDDITSGALIVPDTDAHLGLGAAGRNNILDKDADINDTQPDRFLDESRTSQRRPYLRFRIPNNSCT